jgi:copper chaperone CopZ
MTCGACTSAAEGGFKNIPGVKSFSISLLSERAVIEHGPELLLAEKIAEIIKDCGFALAAGVGLQKRSGVGLRCVFALNSAGNSLKELDEAESAE